mmetsp:Transcript_22893/g.26350  ORF Transcript_22893/g.26350 Transcript_22893/m.26350 type:complete len:149 (+) Transcript_22893:160-606(+)
MISHDGEPNPYRWGTTIPQRPKPYLLEVRFPRWGIRFLCWGWGEGDQIPIGVKDIRIGTKSPSWIQNDTILSSSLIRRLLETKPTKISFYFIYPNHLLLSVTLTFTGRRDDEILSQTKCQIFGECRTRSGCESFGVVGRRWVFDRNCK